MSQFTQTPSVKTADAAPMADSRPVYTALTAPPQARRDFDAALRRATDSDNEASSTEDTKEAKETDGESKEETQNLPAYGALSHWAGGQQLGILTRSESLGSVAGHAPPSLSTGMPPDSVPLSAQTATSTIGQQLRMRVPLGGADAAALALRLTQAGAGQWQLRVGTDAQTRQQLTPHIERLRQRLRQHSQGQMDDFGFDDDTTA